MLLNFRFWDPSFWGTFSFPTSLPHGFLHKRRFPIIPVDRLQCYSLVSCTGVHTLTCSLVRFIPDVLFHQIHQFQTHFVHRLLRRIDTYYTNSWTGGRALPAWAWRALHGCRTLGTRCTQFSRLYCFPNGMPCFIQLVKSLKDKPLSESFLGRSDWMWGFCPYPVVLSDSCWIHCGWHQFGRSQSDSDRCHDDEKEIGRNYNKVYAVCHGGSIWDSDLESSDQVELQATTSGSHLYVLCRSICDQDQNWMKRSKPFLGGAIKGSRWPPNC